MTWWDRLLAWEDRHRFAVDCFLAGVLLLLVVTVSGAVSGFVLPRTRLEPAAWFGVLVAVGATVPLAWRRVRPALSAALVYGVVLVQMIDGPPLALPVDFLVLVALYSVTVHGPLWARRLGLWGAVAGSVLLVVLLVRDGIDPTTSVASGVFAMLMFLVVWAFALVRRSRLLRLEALVDRARQAEIDRDRQAQLATAAERARIAREMHDIVAHSLSVMIAQADGGRYAAASDPPAATRSLETIAETGRAALTDMRRLLGVLRTEPASAGHDPTGVLVGRPTSARPAGGRPTSEPATPGTGSVPVVAPQPAEGDLEDLVGQLRAAGMRVSLARVGAPRNLPPGAGLTVYRIAQESLTNVLKHAGPDPSVTVLLAWRPESVLLEVADDGRGAAADSDGLGHGIVGMRERTAMFGGTLTAGPRPGGGFRVRAEIPTPRGVK